MKNFKKLLAIFTCLTLLFNIGAIANADNPTPCAILEEDVFED